MIGLVLDIALLAIALACIYLGAMRFDPRSAGRSVVLLGSLLLVHAIVCFVLAVAASRGVD
jgi:hypothetical protein